MSNRPVLRSVLPPEMERNAPSSSDKVPEFSQSISSKRVPKPPTTESVPVVSSVPVPESVPPVHNRLGVVMSSAVTSVPSETCSPPVKFTPVPGVSRLTSAPATLTAPVAVTGRSPLSVTVPPDISRVPSPEIVLPTASVRVPLTKPSVEPASIT